VHAWRLALLRSKARWFNADISHGNVFMFWRDFKSPIAAPRKLFNKISWTFDEIKPAVRVTDAEWHSSSRCNYSRCRLSMRSRVYLTVGRPSVRPSVRLSHRSTAATAAGGFAAVRRAGVRYRSTAEGAMLQVPALSSKCGQHHVESRRRRHNTNLLIWPKVAFALSLLCIALHIAIHGPCDLLEKYD